MKADDNPGVHYININELFHYCVYLEYINPHSLVIFKFFSVLATVESFSNNGSLKKYIDIFTVLKINIFFHFEFKCQVQPN